MKPCFYDRASKTDVHDRRASDRDDPDRRHGHLGLRRHRTTARRQRVRRTRSAADPEWDDYAASDCTGHGTDSRRSATPATYEFVCQAPRAAWRARSPSRAPRSRRRRPTATPTPTTPTPTPTPTPTVAAAADAAPPTPDDHRQTPAPGQAAAAKDTEAPRLLRASVEGASRAACSVRFWLSEPATVDVTAMRRGSKTVLSQRHRAGAAGTRAAARAQLSRSRRAHTRSSCAPTDAMGNRAALRPRRPLKRQVSGPPAPGAHPPTRWSRRDFMRNGFGSLALLCTFATPGALRGQADRDVGRDPLAGALAVRAVPARPAADPGAAAGLEHAHARHVRDRHPRGHGRGPARLPDADLRLRRHLPGPDDPRPQGPRGRRPPEEHAAVRVQRAPARRLRARPRTTVTRWT